MPTHPWLVVPTLLSAWETHGGDREGLPGRDGVAAGGGGKGGSPSAAHHGRARGSGHSLFLQQTWSGGHQPPLPDLGPDLASFVV